MEDKERGRRKKGGEDMIVVRNGMDELKDEVKPGKKNRTMDELEKEETKEKAEKKKG